MDDQNNKLSKVSGEARLGSNDGLSKDKDSRLLSFSSQIQGIESGAKGGCQQRQGGCVPAIWMQACHGLGPWWSHQHQAATEQVSATLGPMEPPSCAKGSKVSETLGPFLHGHGPRPVREKETSCPGLPGMEGFLRCGTFSTQTGKVSVQTRMSKSP